jgi:protein O-GlcNAc transferase
MLTQDLKRMLNQGIELQRRGRLAEAEQLYLRLLQRKPDQFEAAHQLGVLRLVQGRCEEALAPFQAALKAKPDAVGALMDYGATLHILKRPEEALASYERALDLRPDHAEALNHHGAVLAELGRYDEALTSFVKAVLIAPDYAEAHYHRGNVLARLGRFEQAVRSYDKAIRADPGYAEAFDNRGNALAQLGRRADALAQLGRRADALASYDDALAIRPDYAGAWYNRGNILADLNRPEDALASYDRALAIWPEHAGARHGRGIALHALGRFEEALASYRAALAIDPDHPEVLYNWGGAEQELGHHEEALASFEKALALRPDYAEALYARGASLHAMNRWRESLASYEQALAVKPDYPAAKFALCMAELPILYATEAEIAERRAAYAERLKSFAEDVGRMTNAGQLAESVGARQPFFLAYQGRNDRELQTIYGSIVCKIMSDRYPPVASAPPPAPEEHVRVGVVSGYFRRHANWRTPIRGWLSQLDRGRFRVFGYHTGVDIDAETEAARALCERFVQGPLSIERWREEIAADAPHILIYPEVGMHTVSAQLAAQRLAAVQCNAWGHPDTSGFPTLDYFLSSDLMEPPDAQEHYTEQLIRLPSLSVYCDPIDKPQVSLERHELGLRSAASVYWCGQSLFKYLPQFDEVFARIAREARDCQFAFVEYPGSPQVTELFRSRLDRAFAALGLRAQDHCVVLPRLEQDRFLAATGLSDVFLDSIAWSGCNSTLEALIYELPIVTMKGDLIRGRHSAALLEMMGMTATIAETIDDYVAIAVRLTRDPAWRTEIRSQISGSKHLIYRDRSCITALEEFLSGSLSRPGKATLR